MGCLCLPLLAGIYLYHARDIERINPSERVCGDENDTTVCVNLLLQISEADGLEHYNRQEAVRCQ